MKDDILHFPEGVLVDDVIGAGLVGIVALREDRKTVIKFAPSNTFQHFIDVERRVYERLNSGIQHDGLLKYYGSLDQGLILEYACNKLLRDYVAHYKEQPLSRRLSWAEQLTASVRFIHTKGILYGDISCNNAFLDKSLKLKLRDFAGSSIDDEPPLVYYDISYEHPDLTDISIKSELFTLRSSLYEIITGSKPY
jgi:serine/threonine protein kinase